MKEGAIVFILSILHIKVCLASFSSSHLRLDPHSYGGPKGAEPREQAIIQTSLFWEEPEKDPLSFEFAFHFEGEMSGRKDYSLDLDRAWVGTALADDPFSPVLFIGRIHPWNVSSHPEEKRPWGLLSNTQPQNRGILLGYGYSPQSPEPNPILLGWMGLHTWSTSPTPIQWGISITPFFVPTLASEVSYSSNGPTYTGRFGRRPPGYVEINGKKIPLVYEIDRSRVFQDVILNPQAMVQIHWSYGENAPLAWLSISRSPSTNPVPDSKGYLQIREQGVEAHAIVRPQFPTFWKTHLTHTYEITDSVSVFNSLHLSEENLWGYELGLSSERFSLSLLDERRFAGVAPKYESPEYSDLLLQGDLHFPLSIFTLFGGAKYHLRQNGTWLRSGVRTTLSREATLDMGGDLFAGNEASYFGEWRTNDRLYLALNWMVW